MQLTLGIRREDKNKWEKRVPLIPDHVHELKEKHQISTIIQPSSIRAYADEEYKRNGAIVNEDLSSCNVIFAVKEIPISFFETRKTYVFFSHIIKGQAYNIPMLKHMMNQQVTLIDYEKIMDENNRRLIFFGRYAGIAGMVDTLWGFGQRLLQQYKLSTPFDQVKHTYEYSSLSELKNHIARIGEIIETKGIPEELNPLIVGFAGYGNVSKGAQEIIDLLPFVELQPKQLKTVYDDPDPHCIYKVVFKEEDLVKPKKENHPFKLQEYYQHPKRYISKFETYLKDLTILMNCIYWDQRYPRLVTKEYLKTHQDQGLRLHIVGDISVDINGGIEPTFKVTQPDQPVFVYDANRDSISDGVTGPGTAIMAVDNLPCELPRDSSKAFSEILWHFIPDILKADFTKSFEDLDLPDEIKNAVILHQGSLTPSYTYINNYL